jgi:hypothetical protein
VAVGANLSQNVEIDSAVCCGCDDDVGEVTNIPARALILLFVERDTIGIKLESSIVISKCNVLDVLLVPHNATQRK